MVYLFAVLIITQNLCINFIHWVQTSPTEGLKSICEGIVADFDSICLKEKRAASNRLFDKEEWETFVKASEMIRKRVEEREKQIK